MATCSPSLRRGKARREIRLNIWPGWRGAARRDSTKLWRGAARPNGVEPLPGAERRDVQLCVMRRGAARRVLVSHRSGVARRGAEHPCHLLCFTSDPGLGLRDHLRVTSRHGQGRRDCLRFTSDMGRAVQTPAFYQWTWAGAARPPAFCQWTWAGAARLLAFYQWTRAGPVQPHAFYQLTWAGGCVTTCILPVDVGRGSTIACVSSANIPNTCGKHVKHVTRTKIHTVITRL